MAEFIRDAAGATEAQQQQAIAYLFANSAGLAVDGVLSGLAVTQTGTASVSVLISAGAAVVQDTVGAGAKQLINNTQKTLDILTANPMGGLPRNDIVVFDAATSSIRAIIGTPNASPTDPTVPATAIALARIRNLASATTIPTAQIDDRRVFTMLAGVKPSATLASRSTDYTLSAGTISPALLTCPMPAVDASTRCRVLCFVPGFSSTVANDRVIVTLYDGAGSQCGGGYVQVNAGVSNGGTFVGQIAAPCPAGSVTMKAQRVSGTGNTTLRGVEGWTLEVIPT